MDSPLPSLESLAFAYLWEKRFPELKRKGFPTAIREAIPESELDIEDGETLEINFRPDGWFRQDDTFTCIEIEDSNPLTVEKLQEYGNLHFTLADHGYRLRLFVFDRYGLNEREIDLNWFYWEIFDRAAGVSREHRPTSSEAIRTEKPNKPAPERRAYDHVCAGCGEPFVSSWPNQRWCDQSCRYVAGKVAA
jgi:hypothetical protein